MPETTGGGAESLDITMPSRLRIRQRLGMVATDRAFKKEFIPGVEKLERQTISAGELVGALETKLTRYAEDNLYGITALALNKMPVIIKSLVDNEQQQASALGAWEARLAELVQQSEANPQR